MMFLKKFIRRRKSYTNVVNSVIKKKAVDISNVCTDKHNFSKNTLLHAHVDSYSNLSLISDIVPEETPKTNFSRNRHFQEINQLQTAQNAVDRSSTLQEINAIETGSSDRSLPPFRRFQTVQNEVDRSSTSQQINAIETGSSDRSLPPFRKFQTVQNAVDRPNTSQEINAIETVSSDRSSSLRSESRNSLGKIKNKNISHLESSIVSLSNTLQNRLVNPPCPTNNNHTDWNLNNLTPEKSFGLLVAIELEKIPEPEKCKRKQAIAEIL
ncbi:uncharacterized protein LOC112637407 [Camponotus floridanus]|uniref:uncharacterized protein LOC112637407 n=1 Tax=Camponotus floridanus TaxID=104421 RepID=UPI000DC6C157|nr:uncharacterized protein LOC112637407 [Camponotus floridanus]